MKKRYWVLLVLLIFEGAYLVGAHWFINQGIHKIVNTKPEDVTVNYSSGWTLIPGLVHLKDVVVQGHPGTKFWQVKVAKMNVLVNIFVLPFRRFECLKVVGSNTQFKIIQDDEMKEPGAIKAEKKPDDPNKKKKGPFRLFFGGISLSDFRTIHVFNYQFDGVGLVEGEFSLWPGRELEIGSSHVEFINGDVTFKGSKLAKGLQGEVNGRIEEFNLKTAKTPEVLGNSSGDINLRGALEGADFLDIYLQGVPWLDLKEVTGSFSTHAFIQKGVLQDLSQVHINASSIKASLSRFEARGSGSANWVVASKAGVKQLQLDVQLKNYSVREGKNNNPIMKGSQLGIGADTADLNLYKTFSKLSDLAVSLDLPKAQILDLQFLNAFIPLGNELNVVGGTGEVSAKINARAKGSSAPGFVRLVAKDVEALYDNVRLKGEVYLESRIHDRFPGTTQFDLSGTAMSVTDVFVDYGKKSQVKDEKNWNGKISIEEATLTPLAPTAFRGKIILDFADARPIFGLYAVKAGMSESTMQLVSMKDLHGTGNIALGKQLVNLEDVLLESKGLTVKGRLRIQKKDKRGVAFFKKGILRVALGIEGKKTEIKLINAESWFDKYPPFPALKN